MKREEFIKAIGLSTGGLLIPTNTLLQEKDIKIYDNYIKGLTHYNLNVIESRLKEGDELFLRREKENTYDSFAIAVYFQEYKLGYIAAFENIVLSNMLDKGVVLQAYISNLDKKENVYRRVAIEVFAKLIVPSNKLITLIQEERRADDSVDLYRNNSF